MHLNVDVRGSGATYIHILLMDHLLNAIAYDVDLGEHVLDEISATNGVLLHIG